MKEFTGRERMLSDWEDILVAIFRAQSGETNITYDRNEKGNVIGINGEMTIGFEMGLPPDFIKDSAEALRVAIAEAEKASNEEGTITSKQKTMIEWFETRNSIVLAESGELKISYHKNDFAGGIVVGVVVEWALQFGGEVESMLSEEQRAVVDEAKAKNA